MSVTLPRSFFFVHDMRCSQLAAFLQFCLPQYPLPHTSSRFLGWRGGHTRSQLRTMLRCGRLLLHPALQPTPTPPQPLFLTFFLGWTLRP